MKEIDQIQLSAPQKKNIKNVLLHNSKFVINCTFFNADDCVRNREYYFIYMFPIIEHFAIKNPGKYADINKLSLKIKLIEQQT